MQPTSTMVSEPRLLRTIGVKVSGTGQETKLLPTPQARMHSGAVGSRSLAAGVTVRVLGPSWRCFAGCGWPSIRLAYTQSDALPFRLAPAGQDQSVPWLSTIRMTVNAVGGISANLLVLFIHFLRVVAAGTRIT